MQVEVKLYGHLKRHAPAEGPRFLLPMETGATVGDLLQRLGIPADGPIALVNGRRADGRATLTGGDSVVLMPPISGG